MRAALALLLLAAAASAQPHSLDARAAVDQQVAQSRARLAAMPDTPVFEASWLEGEPQIGDGMGAQMDEGRLMTRGTTLGQVLGMSWTADFSFGEDPIPSPMRRRLTEDRGGILSRMVRVRMVQPDLSRPEFGPFLRQRLSEALDLEISLQTRPTVTYVLQVADASRLTEAAEGGRYRSGAMDQTFYAESSDSGELARALSGALDHVVIDETGLGGRYDVRMEFDADQIDFDLRTMSASAVDALRAELLESAGLELVPEVRPVEWMIVRKLR